MKLWIHSDESCEEGCLVQKIQETVKDVEKYTEY